MKAYESVFGADVLKEKIQKMNDFEFRDFLKAKNKEIMNILVVSSTKERWEKYRKNVSGTRRGYGAQLGMQGTNLQTSIFSVNTPDLMGEALRCNLDEMGGVPLNAGSGG
jgi:hypothetical protein